MLVVFSSMDSRIQGIYTFEGINHPIFGEDEVLSVTSAQICTAMQDIDIQ
jgi:hypothetical protein